MPVHTIPLRPFTTPNSVTLDMPPGLRQDGMRAAAELPLSSLSRETITALCAEFTSRVLTEYDAQLAALRREDESRVLQMNRGG